MPEGAMLLFFLSACPAGWADPPKYEITGCTPTICYKGVEQVVAPSGARWCVKQADGKKE